MPTPSRATCSLVRSLAAASVEGVVTGLLLGILIAAPARAQVDPDSLRPQPTLPRVERQGRGEDSSTVHPTLPQGDVARQPASRSHPTGAALRAAGHDAGRGAAKRARISIDPAALPAAARQTIETLNVRDADLRDVLRGIGAQYELNVIVDNAIQQRVTIRLSNLSVIDAVTFLCREHGLTLEQTGTIFRVKKPAPAPPLAPDPPDVGVDGRGLSVDLDGDPLRSVVRRVSQATGENIIVRRGVEGTVSGYLEDVTLREGFAALLSNNGYVLREEGDLFVVDRDVRRRTGSAAPGGRHTSLWVNVSEQGRVSLEVREAPIADVMREVARQVDLNIVTYDVPEGRITAVVRGLTIEDVLNLLLRGTNMTYRKDGTTYYVGSRETSGIATTKMIRLSHMKAESTPELLPGPIRDRATIQVIPEHNALMVTGTNDVIGELETALDALDEPTPVILIEALVVDFQSTDLFELGFEFGEDEQEAAEARRKGYRFDGDGFRSEANGKQANDALDELNPFFDSIFGIKNIGTLPDDFFVKLRALSQEGKVEIRSRPQIATLSGHSASLSIGTTQYFILRKETPIQSPGGGVVIQETERFERIEANVSLEVTPWVTAAGEVTTEIRPEFSTPVGAFNAEVPPTINSRVFESTVRLREGETIILGGLIQDDKNVTYNKVPLLGSIPLLGQLFRSRSRDVEKSELVVYLTPRIFYGEQDEPEKWEQLREDMDLRDPRGD